jgi:hypothetical protein
LRVAFHGGSSAFGSARRSPVAACCRLLTGISPVSVRRNLCHHVGFRRELS